ncbi:MAG: hypothetical protein WAL66_01945 [Nitrososphaeraceae archaeon]
MLDVFSRKHLVKNMKNDYSDIRASIYTSMKCIYNPVVEQPIIVDINRQVPNEIAEKFARELLSR